MYVAPRHLYLLSAPLTLGHWLTGNHQLVVFGGFGGNRDSLKDLCVLNDVQIFDPDTQKWLSAGSLNSGEGDHVPAPKPRHSHLSSITADRLFVIGGQDLRNAWLDD